MKTQTSFAEKALPATANSVLRPGNGTWVQVEGFVPLRRQAVGGKVPLPSSNAQPPFRPAAMTRLKPLTCALCTCLTIRQAGVTGWAARGAADAGEHPAAVTASPVIASAVAAPATARRSFRDPRQFVTTFRSTLSAMCSSNSIASIQMSGPIWRGAAIASLQLRLRRAPPDGVAPVTAS